MTFQTLREAIGHFRRYNILTDSGKLQEDWYYRDNKCRIGLEFGDWILFRHIEDCCKISCPILGIFTGRKMWDQAFVMNYVEQPRAWMMHTRVVTNDDIGLMMHVSHLDDKVQYIQFWTDDIVLMGKWNTKPTLKQLRESYEGSE